jgi:murein tripeptide amidase MpaA
MIEGYFKLLLTYLCYVLICIGLLDMNCGKGSSMNELSALHFYSDFEAGAATDFHVRGDGAIGFSIPTEPGGDIVEYPASSSVGEYLWFYFKVVGDGKKQLEFVVENAFGAHQTGWRWKIAKPVFSRDGKTWVRTKYTRYSYLRHQLWRRGIKLLGKPEFRFRAPFTAETLWVAYSYPYTNSDLNSFIEHIHEYSGVTVSTIGKSAEKRDILKVTIAGSSKATGEQPEQIWLVGREHPGETPASFVCEGFIRALLEDAAGKQLRGVYSFSVIPIINVDGVAHGYYYHNANGVNLGFDWEDDKAIETRLLRQAIAPDLKKGALRLMINLHSSNDPTKGHYFLQMRESELRPRDLEFQRSIFQTATGIYPQLQGHSPVTLWDIPGITGIALYRQYGVYCLYLESSYDRGADGSIVTPESLRETGAALVKALARVLLSDK